MSCPDDDTLTAMMAGSLDATQVQQVHAHVDTCSRCQTILGELGQHVPLSSAAPSAPPNPLDRYQRKQLLGEGGMGVVYLALDTVLHRDVALKLIRPDAFGHRESELAQRFVREARALAAINHPHVMGVHDAGFSPEGGYIVLEHVAGMTFGQWMENQPPRHEVVRVMCEIGDALATLHRANLVHRDVKPSNILVTADVRAKLGDFGLVTAGDTDSTLTEVGAAIGTPAYMAPEQLQGHATDARADQYAFCVTLLEGLAGERVSGPRVALRLASEARNGKGIPAALWKLLDRGMHRQPDRRFRSMDELLNTLRRFMLPDAWKGPGCGRALLLMLVALGGLGTFFGIGYIAGLWSAPKATEATSSAPALPSSMRGAWHKKNATLTVTAEGIHSDTTTVSSDGRVMQHHDTLRITVGRANSDTDYRVSNGDTNQALGGDDGCRGAIELRGDTLQVILTGESICSSRLSGSWRHRPSTSAAPETKKRSGDAD